MIRGSIVLAASCLGAAGCGIYFATDAEAKKICSDPELLAIVAENGPDYREQVERWGEANVRTGEAKEKVGFLARPMSRAERKTLFDKFGKEHGLDHCPVADVAPAGSKP